MTCYILSTYELMAQSLSRLSHEDMRSRLNGTANQNNRLAAFFLGGIPELEYVLVFLQKFLSVLTVLATS